MQTFPVFLWTMGGERYFPIVLRVEVKRRPGPLAGDVPIRVKIRLSFSYPLELHLVSDSA